jgi:hypothetical protein
MAVFVRLLVVSHKKEQLTALHQDASVRRDVLYVTGSETVIGCMRSLQAPALIVSVRGECMWTDAAKSLAKTTRCLRFRCAAMRGF